MSNEVKHQRKTPSRTWRIRGAIAAALIATLAVPAPLLAQRGKRDKNDSSSPVSADGKALGEDEALYSCGKAKGKVSVAFKPEVELKDLITWAMGFTCKNFVYGAGIGGRSAKVTIIAPKKMTPQQAWRVFLVAISTMGLTIVPKDNVLKLVESAQSKKDSLPLYRKGLPTTAEQMVRLVLRPEHVNVQDMATALNAMTSKDGQVTTLTSAGVLLVTDYGNHIEKMKALLREVDRPSAGEQLWVIKVKNADVTELATKLTEILGTKDASSSTSSRSSSSSRRSSRRNRKGTTPAQPTATRDEVEAAVPSKIIADERTNALIILASEPAYLRVRALVKRLDIEIGVEGAGRIHVYPLENADSEELANTLTSVVSGVSSSSTSSRTTGRTSRRAPSRSSSSNSAPAFEGQVRVTHDKPTNSLVITASVKDFLALREVIRKLDVPRRQVFIEAVILEVTANTSRNMGVSFHGGKDLDDGSIILGGLQHSDLQSLNVSSLATQTGLLGGAIGPLLPNAEQLLGTSIPSFGLLFQALATNSNVNVLSSPHILTTDNEDAEISVGQNIPYQSSFSNYGVGTGSTSGTTGTTGFGFPVQSIQRQDVALTLKITPHVNASDMVRLEIDQEISDIADPDFEGHGPSWSKRTIKTTVVVRDQQSIVIGGLMADRTTYSESKVPLLGDVPILGYLFKYTQKGKSKTNLLVLLTPYVIKDQMDIERIVQKKTRERAEFLRSMSRFARAVFTPDIDYSRKRGLVEEINHVVTTIEEEADVLRELQQKDVEFPDGPIEYSDVADDDSEVAGSDKGDDEGDDEGDDDDDDAKSAALDDDSASD